MKSWDTVFPTLFGSGLSNFERLRRRPAPRIPHRRAIGLLLLPVSIALMQSRIWAQSGGDDVNPLPEVFGKTRSVQAATSLGAVSDVVPIVVPPGRRNVQPRLALTYSSLGGAGIAGKGWGIDTGVVARWHGDGTPTVGVSDAYSYSIAGAGGELVRTATGIYRAKVESVYREFRKLQDSSGSDYWVMDAGEGVKHYFGSTQSARIDGDFWMLDFVKDASGNTMTYKYTSLDGIPYIDEIRYTGYTNGDLGQNKVKFEYESAARPDTRISFATNLKSGQVVQQVQKLRLSRISVFTSSGTRLVRRYELTFRQSQTNQQSLLARVTLVGSDDTSRITLKELEYTARAPANSWNRAQSSIPLALANYTSNSESASGNDTGTRVLDVNGDGFPDLVAQYPFDSGNTASHGIYLGDGRGGFSRNEAVFSSRPQASNSCGSPYSIKFTSESSDYKGAPLGVQLVDVNADMLPDLVVASAALDYRREVWLNTGAAWRCDTAWTQALAAVSPAVYLVHSGDYVSTGRQFVDVNGDGRTDIIWSEGTSAAVNKVYLNTGSGWAENGVLSASLVNATVGRGFVSGGENQGFTVMDVNGDGLADIIRTVEASCSSYPQARRVYLGTEKGWTLNEGYTHSLCAYTIISISQGKTRTYGLVPVDFNGDGLMDFVRARTGPGGDPNTPGVAVYAYRNTGTGWAGARSGDRKYCHVHETGDDPADYCTGSETDDPVAEQVANAIGNLGLAFATGWKYSKSTGSMFTDVNGDGIPDILRAMGDKKDVWLADSTPHDLLSRATGVAGETTELKWMSSTRLENGTAAGGGMPVPIAVVKEITRGDGRGHKYQISCAYGGGLYGYYNPQGTGVVRDSRFRGFAWSDQALPTGLHVFTRYYQQENLSGVSSTVEKRTAGGVVRARQSSLYEVRSTPIGKQVLLVQSDEELIDVPDDGETAGQAAILHSRLKYSYDEKMNVTTVHRDPEVSRAGDESTTRFSWASNAEAGIWSLPARNTAFGAAGALAEVSMKYDGLPDLKAARGLPSERSSMIDVWKFTVKSMKYDRYGNVVSITDEAGGTTSFEYDPSSTFRVRAVDPEGRVAQSQYDPGFGALLRETDTSGNSTLREYDVFGRLRKVTLPGDETSPFGTRSYEYSAMGNATRQYWTVRKTETPGESGTLDRTTYFDGMGRVYAVAQEGTRNRWIVTGTEFDDADNPIRTSRPFYEGESPLMTEIVRDELGRPVSIREPNGTSVGMSYAGERTDIRDQRGNKSSFYRNLDGKVRNIHRWVDGKEQETSYGYDPLGRLTGITDALGSVTRITYDAQDRRTRLEDSNTGTYTYEYDNAGRLIAQTDPEESVTRFRYNTTGDLLRKDFPDGTYHEFTYGGSTDANATGRVTRIRDAAGVAEISYDMRGNVVERRRSVLGRTYVTGYAYDSLARIRRITYPDGFTAQYEYDAAGNIARIADARQNEIARFTDHNASGQLKNMQFGNGVSSSYDYDVLLRMTSIVTRSASGGIHQNLLYEFDPSGNVQSITDAAQGTTQRFEYDAIDRLTRAFGPDGNEHYEYDAIGNLLRKGALTFSVDPLCPQRLREMGSNGEPPILGVIEKKYSVGQRSFPLVYDQRGNLIQKGSRSFRYDAENHLTRVSDRGRSTIVENVYDALGQLVIQQTRGETRIFIDGIYEEGATEASHHVRAGSLLVSTVVTPIASVQLIAEAPPSPYGLDRSGEAHPERVAAMLAGFALAAFIATPCRARRRSLILLAHSVAGVRERPSKALFLMLFIPVFAFVNCQQASGGIPPARETLTAQTDMRYYYHANHLGSIHVVTDDHGAAIARHEYRPYGEPAVWTGSERASLKNGFNGRRYEEATDLYYFGARFYDPEIGRFLTADTQVPDPMNPKVLHRYAFAGNNPVRYVDPTGHAFWEWFLAGFVIGALIVVGIVTCGVGFAIGIAALTGALLVIVGLAAVAAAAFGAYSAVRMAQSGGDFNWNTFGMALAAGAIVGAAVGAAICLFPYTIGVGVDAAASTGSFFATLAADILFGAVLGGLGQVTQSLAEGNSPEAMLTSALGEEILTSMIKGAILGAVFGGTLRGVSKLFNAYKFVDKICDALGVLLVLEDIGELELSAARIDFSFSNVFGSDANWLVNTPMQPAGLPSWPFEGTGLGYRRGNAMGSLLNTMPLTP